MQTHQADLEAKLLIDSQCTLAEGPVWDESRQQLLWVDILQKTVHCYDAGSAQRQVTEYPETVGTVALTDNGNWLVALKQQVLLCPPFSSVGKILFSANERHPANRFNDGKCTPDGAFLVGTMDMDEKAPNGKLYWLDARRNAKTVLPAVTISNGMAWDLPRKRLYYIDTPTQQVQVASYDPVSGEMGAFLPFLNVPSELGFPDGMTIDEAGNLYIAMWSGARVAVFSGDSGTYLYSIKVAAPNTTCPVFGGENMNELFISTARVGLNDSQLQKYPASGGIFRVKLAAKGLPTYRFREG